MNLRWIEEKGHFFSLAPAKYSTLTLLGADVWFPFNPPKNIVKHYLISLTAKEREE